MFGFYISLAMLVFLSASLYFSKRGAYRDRLCRDVVGRWPAMLGLMGFSGSLPLYVIH